MFILDLFKILGNAGTISEVIKAIKEIREAIEAIQNVLEKFKDDDKE